MIDHCLIIQDLLPLYHDGVCSTESSNAVEQHLKGCAECQSVFQTLCDAEELPLEQAASQLENQKAASFHSVKRRIAKKQMLAALAAAVILIASALITVGILKSSERVVAYQDNISVHMMDGSLVGRLEDSMEIGMHGKRVSAGGQELFFFSLTDTRWNDLITGERMYSEFTLCPEDKGADQISAVYYYTGDFTGLESMSEQELGTVIEESIQLWSRS